MKLYDHIDDLPIYNYLKIKKTGDLKYLCIVDDYREFKPTNYSELKIIWEGIVYQLMEKNGIPEDQQLFLNREKELVCLNIEYITTGNKELITLIEKQKKELELILKQIEKENNKSMTLDETISYVEQKNKFQFDFYKTSISRFFDHLNLIKKQRGNAN